MARVSSSYGRYQSIAAFLLYLALSILIFGRGLAGRFTTACIGLESDPPMFMWYLRWWRYALEHRVNPFLTDLLWAPPGFNLAWSTFIPLPAWIVMPLGRAFGETASYNFLCLIALPLAATAAFLLCRRVTTSFWPSLLGGYIFGFSPFMLGEMLGGHLHLILAFPIPLAVLSALRRLDGEISACRFTLEISVLLVVQFLCGVELFATMAIFAGIAMLVALVFFDDATRARLLGLIAPLAAAYALAMLAVAPYLYYLFALGFPHAPIWSPAKFTGDLLNFFIPTEANLLGTFGFARAISAKFTGDLYENGVYIGVPLLIMIEVYRRSAWRTAIGKFLIVTLGVAVVASFGPVLRIAGRPLSPMPWALVANLPVISNAIAARFSMYVALVTSLIAAIWFTSASARTSTKIVAALLVVVFLAPNPSALFWTRPLALPVFFADQTLLHTLKPREVVLPVPYGERGDCMYWQERTDMYFRMASGWTGITPSEFEQMPIVNFFYGETDLVEPGDQLKAFIARFAVTAIVADPSYERFPIFGPALASLGVAAEPVGGVLVYKIPPGKFAAYAELKGAELEARALALRFDSILAATASYIDAGNDPLKLSALELQRHNLLPPDWRIDTARNSLIGWSIGYLPDKRIAVALYGFDQGLKPLLDRYSGKVSELLYPAPSRWNPRSAPVDDRSGTALIIFDPAQFEAAVRQLKSSPPPEMTNPFLGADSH